jgi:hypothetical protein
MPYVHEDETVTGSDQWLVRSTHHSTMVIETTREDEAAAHKAVPPELVLDIERHTPEGAGPKPHEHVMPYLMGALALLGVTLIGIVFGVTEGWRAALLGIGAVMTGCSVGWIVVWGAGLMRVREERQISDEVEAHVVDHPRGIIHPG